SHPTQYGSPMWRRFAKHPNLDVLVAYCGMQGAQGHVDPGFGIEVAWDVPLLDDYPWVQIKNISPISSRANFFNLVNPGIWKLIRTGKFDVIAIFTGYVCATFWIALTAAKFSRTPVMYGTDATSLESVDGRAWKISLKKLFWPRLFRMAEVVFAPSSGTAALMRSLNIPDERIHLMPYVVDNDWWIARAKDVDRLAVRRKWKVPDNANVVLFCAKLQPWKRPADVLRAFHRAEIPNGYLVFAGEGPLRKELECDASQMGISDKIRFLGFVNQSGLPEVYVSSDVMVLPSEYEPFGLVVNEAMLCGCGVIVSDHVGARFDLVKDGETGRVYPCGDISSLSRCLRETLSVPESLSLQRRAARDHIAKWSPAFYVQKFVRAVAKAQGSHNRVFRKRTQHA